MLFSEFSAVLDAELVGTGGTAERFVAVFPESFGIHHHAQLPHNPNAERKKEQRGGIESACEYKRGEHHKMVPVEYATGGAAAIFHDEPERTPDQHADEVADIEEHADHEKNGVVDHAEIVQQSDDGQKNDPDDENLVRGFGGRDHVFAECGMIDLFADRLEFDFEQFLRPQRDIVLYGNQLEYHINDPDYP